MKKTVFNTTFLYAVVVALLMTKFIFMTIPWQHRVLDHDGKGYFAYLPAYIIYHELDFEQTLKAEREVFGPDYEQFYINNSQDSKFNKCFPGAALLQLPFFIIGYLLALIGNYDLSGYSPPFMFSFVLGAFFYAVLAFSQTRQILEKMKFSKSVIDWTLFSFFLGTGILLFSTRNISMSHIYSFALFAIIINTTLKNVYKFKDLMLLCSGLALVFALRPTNLFIIIALPAFSPVFFRNLYSGWQNLKFSQKIPLIFPILLACSPFILLKIHTGYWFIDPYPGEGFVLNFSHYWKTLFSFRNGLFIWSPIILLSLFGWIYYYRLHKKYALILGFYLIVTHLVISSWWIWNYGGSLGNRAYTEHSILTLIFLAFLLGHIEKSKWFLLAKITLASLVMLQIVQTYQLTKGIISADYMNGEMYVHSFLRTSDRYQGECNATHDFKPLGKTIKRYELKSDSLTLNKPLNYLGNIRIEMEENHRPFLIFNYQKRRLTKKEYKGVFLYIKGFDSKKEIFHQKINLYDIKSEAYLEWKALKIEATLGKGKCDRIDFWISNPFKIELKLKEIKLDLELISTLKS